MKTVVGVIKKQKSKSEKSIKSLKKLYQNLVHCNLEIICAVPPHGLIVTKFQPDLMKTVGGVIRKPSLDGWTDTEGHVDGWTDT